MYALVLVELSNVFINKTFTYKIPNGLINKIDMGMRVKVPFGEQVLEGFVLDVTNSFDNDMELKEITDRVDEFPILDDELLSLGKYVSEITLSSLINCYQVMLPKALKARVKVNINPKYKTYIVLNKNCDIKFNNKQQEIIDMLNRNNKVLKQVLNDISSSSVKTLLKKDIIKEIVEEDYRYNIKSGNKNNFKLLPRQQEIYDYIIERKNIGDTFLIHGVTGSGKTNIYMEIIKNIINDGKQVIVLVPEISLTPQIIERFTSQFDRIAVWHSKLSDGEKYDEWRKIKKGEVDIVIGARSAIFAPFSNLGLIVIDEEHAATYKQESSPRYSTIDVAKYRSNWHKCPLILGSATPSLETYARAQKGVYHLLELKERANNRSMPKVEIIDMNQEFKKANGFISNILTDKIKEKIDLDEQVILFLNRRGYANFVTCSSCGQTYKCPHCDISLTYHKTSNILRCHYCGYATKLDDKCSNCGGDLTTFGIGTEKVQEEIEKIIPKARVVRMDIDTTSRKNAHEQIIKDFEDKKYNILLGTQMIAKGLDFADVTLVGVINADISLNFPDFRSSEYTFQLLNQVSGRSGRGYKDGEVLIQTFNPEHYAIVYSVENDYLSFYNQEMEIRKKLSYPPYYYIVLIKIISKDYEVAKETSNKIGGYLKSNLDDQLILGPGIANPFRVNNLYRFQIIVKYKKIDDVLEKIKYVNENYFGNKKVKVEIDFNPLKM